MHQAERSRLLRRAEVAGTCRRRRSEAALGDRAEIREARVATSGRSDSLHERAKASRPSTRVAAQIGLSSLVAAGQASAIARGASSRADAGRRGRGSRRADSPCAARQPRRAISRIAGAGIAPRLIWYGVRLGEASASRQQVAPKMRLPAASKLAVSRSGLATGSTGASGIAPVPLSETRLQPCRPQPQMPSSLSAQDAGPGRRRLRA